MAKAGEHGLFDVRRVESILLADLASQEYLFRWNRRDYEDSEVHQGRGHPPSDMSQYGIEEEDDHAQ